MKKIFSLVVIALFATQAFGQIKLNPQLGVSFMSISDLPSGVTFNGNAGASIGADLRIGDRFQIIPGLHYLSTVSAFQNALSTTTGDISTDYLKIKALASYSIVNAGAFKLRINAGPSYDFLVSKKSSVFGNINSGDFFLQGGIGIDVLFITADLGYAQGLTDKFALHSGSKSSGLYASVGIIF